MGRYFFYEYINTLPGGRNLQGKFLQRVEQYKLTESHEKRLELAARVVSAYPPAIKVVDGGDETNAGGPQKRNSTVRRTSTNAGKVDSADSFKGGGGVKGRRRSSASEVPPEGGDGQRRRSSATGKRFSIVMDTTGAMAVTESKKGGTDVATIRSLVSAAQTSVDTRSVPLHLFDEMYETICVGAPPRARSSSSRG